MSKKISFQNYIKYAFNGEKELYNIYKNFKHINISGFALTCVARCSNIINNTPINGMVIKNNGVLSVSPIKGSVINTFVKGSVQSDLNSNENNEIYKLFDIKFFVPQLHQLNGGGKFR